MYSPLMFPFWGNPTSEDSLFSKELFDSYPFNVSDYQITDDISKAEMVFTPFRHQWLLVHDLALLEECAKAAKSASLPLLVDGLGDIETPLTIENSYILRLGGYRFMPEPNKVQLPPGADDLLERCKGSVLELRTKEEGSQPVVAFAGWSHLSVKQRVKTYVKELPIRFLSIFDSRYKTMRKGVWWRERAVRILQRSTKIECNFLLRSSFSGSSKTAEYDLRKMREEFVGNLLQSDYGLCIRGDGNASTRLFETLSLGRIPVILDTECIFPFSDLVDYSAFSLKVDFRDIALLPDKIAAFHNSLTAEQFEDMQRAARAAFVTYFRPDVMMPHIIHELTTLGALRR